MLKFIKHHMDTISGIGIYPVLSFVIFFTFFLGQRLRALGEIVVYEFDFDGPEPREYQAALRLPFSQVEAPEVRDGT